MSLAAIMDGYKLMHERLHPYPEHGYGNFMETATEIATAPERDLDPGLHRISISRTPAWQFSFAEKVVYASKPVMICITKGENLYFAENSNLDIVATGETVFDAINEFSELLVDFYCHYRGLDREEVTGDAKRLKALYDDLFTEIAVEGRP